jgi:hypothetical protein
MAPFSTTFGQLVEKKLLKVDPISICSNWLIFNALKGVFWLKALTMRIFFEDFF